jgi:hypothetical protein
MSRQRWALPLFVAALAVFWGGLFLSGMLFHERDGKRAYPWPADAAAVRQVVIEVPDSSADLSWSADHAPGLEAIEPAYAQPSLVLVREGDTLYVRPSPALQAAPGRHHRRGGSLKLRLPRQVERVVGDELTLAQGTAPVRLELVGQRVQAPTGQLDSPIQRLRVVGAGVPCPRSAAEGQATLSIEAANVQQLEVDILGGRVSLKELGKLPVVSLRGPANVSLGIDHVGDLARLRTERLPPERQAELQKLAQEMHTRKAGGSCSSRGWEIPDE